MRPHRALDRPIGTRDSAGLGAPRLAFAGVRARFSSEAKGVTNFSLTFRAGRFTNLAVNLLAWPMDLTYEGPLWASSLHHQGDTIESIRSTRRAHGRLLAAGLALTLAAPSCVWGDLTPLGTARGFGSARLSVDAHKSWLPIGARSFPILEGAELRSAGGGAVLDLTDGGRLDVFPFSVIRFEASGQAAKISLLFGRVRFRLPEQSRVEILTPSEP